MRQLFHLAIDPGSRAVRIALAEKSLDVELKAEPVWERRQEFLALNPAGEIPVLVEEDGTPICGAATILDYLDDAYPERPLIHGDALARAEIRRLTDWFLVKFAYEVTDCLVGEKLMKRFLVGQNPSSDAIRAGLSNIHGHLTYIEWLSERRTWLGGDHLSRADVAAAAHLSAVDYLGDVPWADHPEAKEYYARLKSRPSMRSILADHVPGAPPPKHYADLDF
ncbi:MAG: glutathione S-transferase family protein [Alphaproteobacteria bacterium]|nr:glutathione S-transferase family protein [Alphaproteobacteria bacterium]